MRRNSETQDAHARALSPARRRVRRWLLVFASAVMVANATPALSDEYDDTDSGHPIRIIAYALHPVGVVLDYLILRPAHWIGSHEPFKTLFGHED